MELNPATEWLVVGENSNGMIRGSYELASQQRHRPDICIGTDDYHTSASLRDAFVTEFRGLGWSVKVNEPFSGALVPSGQYRRNRRVQAIIIEVNRRLYLRAPLA